MNVQRDYESFKIDPKLNERFLDWSSIQIWVENRLKRYPTLQKIVIGETYEKRELFVLKISSGYRKPAVFILGAEQGRDWMSPAVIFNFIESLLTNKFEMLTNTYDMYFMPVFNPDGYKYSMTEDRFWNKNRKVFFPKIRCFDNHIAIGVNIDLNWHYTKSTRIQYTECNSVYIGHKPITEEETTALAYFLNTIADSLMGFVNLRGFAKHVTMPYANNEVTNNYAIVTEIILYALQKVFNVFNATYELCYPTNCFYNTTGNCPDWVKKHFNVPIVYTMFMKEQNTFLPHIEHIEALSHHFAVIVNETMILSHSIYGPLFNHQPMLFYSCFTIIMVLMLLME